MVERALRRNPATLVILALAIVGAVFSRGLRGPVLGVQFAVGTGYEQVVDAHRWWTPLTSVFVTNGGLELPITLAGIVLAVGAAERLMGTLRTVIAFVVTAIAGAVVGIIVQQVGYAIGELWSRRVSELVTLDPPTAIAGTILTASAFAGPLWRRRIRVLTFGVAAVFLLYSGQPSDMYRMLACLAGLALGIALSPDQGTLHWQRSSHHETRVLLSALVAITAVGPAITVVSRLRLGALAPLGLLLTDANPGGVGTVDECHATSITRACLHDMTLERISGVGPVLVTVLPMLTLLVAALGILLGRRFAAILAIVVNLALAGLAAWFYGFLPFSGESWVLQFHQPHYWEVRLSLVVSVLLPLAIAVLLAANLKHVTLRASSATVRGYLASIAASFLGLSALYLVTGLLLPGGFHPRVTLFDLLVDLPERFVPIGFVRIERLQFLPTDPVTGFVYYWIGPIFWLIVIAGALVVVLTRGSRAAVAGRARVRGLLRAGAGSLSFWSTWEGNSYWFSADERAAVAYRVIGGVAITSSEPIGEHDASIAALAEFARFCDDNGWIPVFYSIHEDWRRACEELGFSSMNVGDETVILPGEWATTGKRWQDVRTSINRAERAGVHSLWTSYAALSASHVIQVGEISEAWVAQKDLPEMGFTLGGIDELRDPEVMLMLAVDAEDTVLGITSWLPGWRDGRIVGWTLDFMRRTPDGPNGIMEFIIARCAEQFRAQGIEWMSLSAAPLASGGGSTPSRLLSYIGARLEPVYGFRSLFAFKRKFDPQLLPLSMAYPDALALPAIGLALARAYVPSLSMRQSIRFVRSLS